MIFDINIREAYEKLNVKNISLEEQLMRELLGKIDEGDGWKKQTTSPQIHSQIQIQTQRIPLFPPFERIQFIFTRRRETYQVEAEFATNSCAPGNLEIRNALAETFGKRYIKAGVDETGAFICEEGNTRVLIGGFLRGSFVNIKMGDAGTREMKFGDFPSFKGDITYFGNIVGDYANALIRISQTEGKLPVNIEELVVPVHSFSTYKPS
jgi:hypothetical protein